MINPYPLSWIKGKSRTKSPERSRFKVSFAKARDSLLKELEILGATSVVISSNVPTRQDGLPYATHSPPSDKGVVVYFKTFKRQHAIACDKYDGVGDNIRAIALTIAATRAIERYGAVSMQQAFNVYALPEAHDDCWSDLGISPNSTRHEIKARYRKLSQIHHPDVGGDRNQWEKIYQAYQLALETTQNS